MIDKVRAIIRNNKNKLIYLFIAVFFMAWLWLFYFCFVRQFIERMYLAGQGDILNRFFGRWYTPPLRRYFEEAGQAFFVINFLLSFAFLTLFALSQKIIKQNLFIFFGIGISILYIFLALKSFNYTLDDSFIGLRYAKNLANYGQLVWNVGESVKTEGYSSLLWVLMCSLFQKFIRTDLFYAAKYLSLFWGILTIIMTLLIGKRLFRNNQLCLQPAMLLAVTSPMLLWGVSGMETTFFVFLVMAAVYSLLIEEERGVNFFTPLLLFLVSIARIEGIIFYCSVVFLRIFFAAYYKDRRYYLTEKRYLWWNCTFLILFTGYLIWRATYYGFIFPLPVFLKRAHGLEGINYVLSFAAYLYPFIIFALIGIIRNANKRKLFYLIFPALFYFAAVSTANPIMGDHYRLILAGFPLVYLIAYSGLDGILDIKNLGKTGKLISCCLLVLLVFYPIGSDSLFYLKRSGIAGRRWSVLTTVHIGAGIWLKEYCKTQDNATVALSDAGATPYYSELNCIDFYGLNDREIATKGFSAQRLLEREPKFIILKSQSGFGEFKGADSPCGQYSDLIYNDGKFKKSYKLKKIFTIDKPFYSLWLYELQNGNIIPLGKT